MTGLTLRSKLALMFISVCIATFGIGGYVLTNTAKEALETEVNQRLESQARMYSTALDSHLRMLTRRIEDFASDGFIRSHVSDLLDGKVESSLAREQLREHLSHNKLTLEPAFLHIELCAPDGETLVSTRPTSETVAWPAANVAVDESIYSNLFAGENDGAPPRMAIATPLHSLDRRTRLGRLVAWIHPGVWVVNALQVSHLERRADQGHLGLYIVDRAGTRLTVHSDLTLATGPSAESELVRSGYGLELTKRPGAESSASSDNYSQDFPISSNLWMISVELPGDEIRSAISGLQSRFVAFGFLLSLLACVLFLLPMSFVTRPLQKLQSAARRLAGGDLNSRVEVDSADEFGELAETFNTMTDAIAQRAHRLEKAADTLRERQEELSFERDRLRTVIASMHDGLVVLDADGKTVIHNDAAGPLLEALGTNGLPLSAHHTCTTAAESHDACRKCLFSPELGSRSCVLEIGGGVYEIHATQLAPNASGQAGRVLVSYDVSDRIAQDERQMHQERLAVLGEVAAVMAHELNNPLAAISLYNQMLGSELQGQESLQENVEVIQRNVNSCKQTIRELLDYATNTTPQLGSVDVNATLEDGSDFLRLLRERSNVTLTMNLTESPLEVNMDEIQLRQVFVNLVVNAIQSTGVEGGEVSVTSSEKDGYAIVDVRDSGCGIPPELRQKIFRPFFTTKERGEGTGLGLPTARRITEMHGGSLQLVSSSPAGSHFQVRLLLDRALVS